MDRANFENDLLPFSLFSKVPRMVSKTLAACKYKSSYLKLHQMLACTPIAAPAMATAATT